MSACAGSSTERTCRFTSCVPREHSGPQEHDFLSFFAGQVRRDRAPGRIGFMSTQRRENRWRRISCTQHTGLYGKSTPGPVARCACTNAGGGTAPPETPAWLATNSLQSGHRIVQLVQFVQIVRRDYRHSSPPFGAGPGLETGTIATHGSSPPRIPSPSGPARLLPTLPWVPVG